MEHVEHEKNSHGFGTCLNRTLEDNSHSAVFFHFTSVKINQLEMCLLWPLKRLTFTHPELIKKSY